jgi:hypothetical protein
MKVILLATISLVLLLVSYYFNNLINVTNNRQAHIRGFTTSKSVKTTHATPPKTLTPPKMYEPKTLQLLLDNVGKGNEQSVIDIVKIYTFGIHPDVKPDTYTASKIINIINSDYRFSSSAKLIASEMQNELKYESSNVISVLPIDITQQILDKIPLNGFETHVKVVAYHSAAAATEYQQDLFDIENIDVEMQHRILAQIEANRIVNPSYTQNVHSTSLQNAAKQVIDTYAHVEQSLAKSEHAIINEIRNLLSSKEEVENAIATYESLESDKKHSRYDKTEKEVFDIVYNMVSKETDWKVILFKSLASCVEQDSIVCSTGKIVRIIGSLEGLGLNEQHNLPTLQPEYIIDNEIGQLAIKIKDDILSGCPKEDMAKYENGENIILEEKMKNLFKNKLFEIYDGILSKPMMEAKYEHFAIGF